MKVGGTIDSTEATTRHEARYRDRWWDEAQAGHIRVLKNAPKPDTAVGIESPSVFLDIRAS